MGLASINIKFSADLKQFSSEMQNVSREVTKIGKSLQNVGAVLSVGLTAPILAFGVASVNAFDESAKAIAQVDAALKSTGGTVGFNSEQLQKMAADLQSVTTFDDDKILKEATANLLTFNKVTGDTFIQAQKAALDLATRLDGDLQSATLQVGKALQDPVKGITALSKAGVSFSSEQKATIKAMVATNNVAGAQSIILKELNKEFGGSAEAAAKAGTGSFKQLTNQIGDLSEEFGKIVVDALQPFVAKIKDAVTYLQGLSPEAKKTIAVIAGIAAVIGPVLVVFGTLLTLFPLMVTGFASLTTAVGTFTAFIAANPFGALAIAIGLVVGALVLFRKEKTSLNDVIQKGNKAASDEIGTLDKLYTSATNVKLSTEERKKAVDQLQTLYPAYFKNLDDEAIKNGTAKKSYDELRDAIFNKARATAIDNELQKRANERVQKEIELRDEIAATEKEIARLRKGADVVVLQEASAIEKTAQVTAKKSELIAAQTKLLGIQNANLKKFNAEALKDDQTLLSAKQQYDAKTGKLAQNEIERMKAIGTNADTLSGSLERINTIAFFEKQITDLKKLQKEIPTTNVAWQTYEDKITSIQKKIDAIEGKGGVKLPRPALPKDEPIFTPSFSLEDLKKQQSYYEGLRDRFSKTSDDYKYYSEQVSNTEIKIKAITGIDEVKSQTEDLKATLVDLGPAISEGFGSAFATIAEGFGEIIANFTTGGSALISIGGLIFNTLGNLAIQVGKIAISTGIAILGIKKSLESLNPYVAIAAGVALIALGTVVKSQLASAGAFANGGIVGGSSFYGDKILARVNSGELILNSQQQKNLYGQLGTGYNRAETLISDVKISGSDLLILFNRAEKQKGRIG